MTALETALRKMKGQSWLQLPFPFIEDYLRTGNPKALAKINSKNAGGYWGSSLARELARPTLWTDEDRRAVDVLCAAGQHESLFERLDPDLATEAPDEDLHKLYRERIKGLTARKLATLTAVRTHNLLRDGKPTSAARFLLGTSDKDLGEAVVEAAGQMYEIRLFRFLLEHAPQRVPALAEHVLDNVEEFCVVDVVESLLKSDGKAYASAVGKRYRSTTDKTLRLRMGFALAAFDPVTWGPVILADARSVLAQKGLNESHVLASDWILKATREGCLQELEEALSRQGAAVVEGARRSILSCAIDALKDSALPLVHTTIRAGDGETRLEALPILISRQTPGDDAVIQTEIERGLKEPEGPIAIKFIGLAGSWKPDRLESALWTALNHKSRPFRATVARTLGRLGDAAIPKAVALFKEKKADTRAAAVTILATINSPKALEELEKRLDVEEDDDVRDAILRALEAAWEAAGRKITPKDIQARIQRCADKLKILKVDKLPPLKYATGKRVEPDTVRYLLYRQSRAKEIRADLEAKPLYALIDRASAGNFALEVLGRFLKSGAKSEERWSLAMAGLLGDDRVVTLLMPKIRDWADSARGKLAEYAVHALALLGTDVALLSVDAMAIRYRTKYKNIGKAAVEAFAEAAEAAGLTPDELGDRVVPWLGFEPGKPRLIDKKIQVSIGLDFKLQYLDVEKRKAVAPPKMPELKELGASLREVVKAQHLRLENLMVRQRRWPSKTWKEMFLAHPLLVPFAVRLIWGAYDGAGKLLGTFRALEDRSLSDAADDAYELPATAAVGIIHPLEIPEELRKEWVTHLADNEIEPPFPQMERPVVLVKAEERDIRIYKSLHGKAMNGMTFKGRAERLGWSRGSVVDGGGIAGYRKGFPAVGVDVCLSVEGMYIGMDMYTEITLGNAYFVRSGSVKFGSYIYDEPNDEKDERILPFGEVPAIVYSESMGDLQRIAAGKADIQEG
jgi:hypothetical protein